MSLDPAWYSTIFGLIFVAAWSLSALAFTILVMSWLKAREPMNEVVQPRHFHDWGNLTLALVMLWTYFAFSQYLIIWSGNLPEETTWFVARKHGGWGAIALIIVILQFAFPFMMLLSRTMKKSAQKLALLAILILAMRIVDVIWLIEPTFSHGDFVFNWMDYVAPMAIGGLWMATFAWQLQKHPLLPINDPQLEQALVPVHGH
jgi:amino acid permease